MRLLIRCFTALFVLICCFSALNLAGAQDSYIIPPDPAGTDLSIVVAVVGDQPMTLGQFRARVRYERWRYFETLLHLVQENGPDALNVNDLHNPQADVVRNAVTLLGDQATFGLLVYETMIREAVYHQELQIRGLEIDPCAVSREWSITLALPEPIDCQPAPEFEQARADYIRRAITFSGMSEAEIEQTIVSRVEVDAVQAAIRVEATPPPQPMAMTHHIRLNSLGEAQIALARLQTGEDFATVMNEMTIDENVNGNGGDLGWVRRDRLPNTVVEAVMSAPIGQPFGPLQALDGFHVFEVLARSGQRHVWQILTETEEAANEALARVEAGEDFAVVAAEVSIEPNSAERGGDLGFASRGQIGGELEETLFSAPLNELIGPVQTRLGYHVFIVTEETAEADAVHLRHMLFATPEESQAALTRLQAGEDFAAVAREVSRDLSAAGSGGDTLMAATNGQSRGVYTAEQMPAPIAEAVFAEDVSEGDILGPIETEFGYFIIEVQSLELAEPNPERLQHYLDDLIQRWEAAETRGANVHRSEDWQLYIPADPQAVNVDPLLRRVDRLIAAAAA